MNHVVDTIVIGAGPAGVSCAIRLQKAGVSTWIVEKRSFPRDKTCGGLITEKTLLLLSDLLDASKEELAQLFCDESDAIKLHAKDEL